MDKDVHAIQAGILKELLLKKEARFSALNVDTIPTDQFTFHVKQLLERGIIEKTDSGSYRLTIFGKEYANRFDIDSGPVKFERQAKIGVLVVATRNVGGKKEYLMQERQKHPFFGFRGFITGKVKIGESIAETAKRELLEEAGFAADVEPRAVYHERILSQEGDLLEDKNFFVFTAANLRGELVAEFSGGRNRWIAAADVLKGNIFYDIADLLALIEAKHFTFSERSYVVDEY
jgi:8-oxo-dGTP pyrophosphatase MutT (NUDIX family)